MGTLGIRESSGITASIAAAISAMGARRGDPGVARSGCTALLTIAEDGVFRAQAVASAGGAAAAVNAILGHLSELSVAATGSAALTAIAAGGEPCVQAVVDACGVQAVLAALRAHPSEVLVVMAGCGMIRSVAEESVAFAKLVAEAGGVAAAVAALQTHPSVTGRESNLGPHSSSADRLIPCPPHAPQDVGVQVAALSCLSCLAVSSMGCGTTVAEAGGATAAVAALRAHPSEKEVQATEQVSARLPSHLSFHLSLHQTRRMPALRSVGSREVARQARRRSWRRAGWSRLWRRCGRGRTVWRCARQAVPCCSTSAEAARRAPRR